jgi:hypothetical protein
MSAEDLIPPPAAVLQRIEALQRELKALRRLLRVSRDAEQAKAARLHHGGHSTRASTSLGLGVVAIQNDVERAALPEVAAGKEEPR